MCIVVLLRGSFYYIYIKSHGSFCIRLCGSFCISFRFSRPTLPGCVAAITTVVALVLSVCLHVRGGMSRQHHCKRNGNSTTPPKKNKLTFGTSSSTSSRAGAASAAVPLPLPPPPPPPPSPAPLIAALRFRAPLLLQDASAAAPAPAEPAASRQAAMYAGFHHNLAAMYVGLHHNKAAMYAALQCTIIRHSSMFVPHLQCTTPSTL